MMKNTKTPGSMTHIRIQQLDKDGKVYRQFDNYCWPRELESKLDRISRAFNMDHTRIMVDGTEV